MLAKMTDEQIDARLDSIERMISKADAKQLPALNQTFQRLIDEQVRRDLEKQYGRSRA